VYPCPTPSGKTDTFLQLTAQLHHRASDYGY
jgi:hypothetical protein